MQHATPKYRKSGFDYLYFIHFFIPFKNCGARVRRDTRHQYQVKPVGLSARHFSLCPVVESFFEFRLHQVRTFRTHFNRRFRR